MPRPRPCISPDFDGSEPENPRIPPPALRAENPHFVIFAVEMSYPLTYHYIQHKHAADIVTGPSFVPGNVFVYPFSIVIILEPGSALLFTQLLMRSDDCQIEGEEGLQDLR